MNLDQLINKKVTELYLNGSQKEKIKTKLEDLKTKLKEIGDLTEIKHGGSYQRSTLVNGLSDVDLYGRYTGEKIPQSFLEKTKDFLKKKYEDVEVKISSPSISLEFKKINIEITPFILNKNGGEAIPSRDLQKWNETDLFNLKNKIKGLRGQNERINDVIKILKYWNSNNGKRFRSFEIESLLYNQFNNYPSKSTKWYILNFFKGNPKLDQFARKFGELIEMDKISNAPLRKQWNQFIDGK